MIATFKKELNWKTYSFKTISITPVDITGKIETFDKHGVRTVYAVLASLENDEKTFCQFISLDEKLTHLNDFPLVMSGSGETLWFDTKGQSLDDLLKSKNAPTH
jgi:hypothetical protein